MLERCVVGDAIVDGGRGTPVGNHDDCNERLAALYGDRTLAGAGGNCPVCAGGDVNVLMLPLDFTSSSEESVEAEGESIA